MASISWPVAGSPPDNVTIGTNTQGELTVLQAPLVAPPVGGNWLSVPMPPPANLSASASTTGGSLPAGTYYYVVTALDGAGGETTPSNEASATTTGTTGSITLTFNPGGGIGFKVYRGTTPGGENEYVNISSTQNHASNMLDAVKWTDNGSVTYTSGSPPTTNTATQMDYNPATGRLRWAKQPELGLSWGPWFYNSSGTGEYNAGSFALVDAPANTQYRWAVGPYASSYSPMYAGYGTSGTGNRLVELQPNGGVLYLEGSNGSSGLRAGYTAYGPPLPGDSSFGGIAVSGYNRVFGQNLNAQTTTSTTPVAATVNWGGTTATSVNFTPRFLGRVRITAHFQINNNTVGDGVTVTIDNNGTVILSETYTQEGAAGNPHDVAFAYEYGTGVVAALTKNTTYTFTVNYNAVTGGTASLTVYGVLIEEF